MDEKVFEIFLISTGEGMQWHNFWNTVTPDDDLVLGHIFIMLLVDALIYLLLALYIEAVAPGEYGVPKPWYFLFQVRINMFI
jgi:ATP-binding cassette subfamily A (ABC1) protein 3